MGEVSLLPNLWQACWKDNDLRFGHFKKLWRIHDCGKLHNIRLPEEDDEPYMQEVFRHVTDKLLAEPDPRRRAFYVFTLYVLHETQVTDQPYKILMPEYMWSIITDMLKEFAKLEVNDPYYVLRTILDRGMISFTLEYNFLPQDVVPGPTDDNKFAGLVAPPEYVGNMGANSSLSSHLELAELEALCAKYSQVMMDFTGGYPQQPAGSENGSSSSSSSQAQSRGPEDPNHKFLAQLKHTLRKHQMNMAADEALREEKQANGDEPKVDPHKGLRDKLPGKRRRRAKDLQPAPMPDFTDITKHGRPKHENLPVSEGVQKALDQWAKAKVKQEGGANTGKKKGAKPSPANKKSSSSSSASKSASKSKSKLKPSKPQSSGGKEKGSEKTEKKKQASKAKMDEDSD